MRKVRTYHWDGTRWLWKRPWRRPRLRFGNAGDLLANDVIRSTYGAEPIVTSSGPRLLTVGSISHVAVAGDVLCGIGVKHPEWKYESVRDIHVWGVRGPLSLEVLASAGFDVSSVRFVFDPGMLVHRLGLVGEVSEPSGRVFVPHYREATALQTRTLPSDLRVVSVDCSPTELVASILRAEVVYTSSLHAVIFAHALGRPVVLVRPQTDEPLFKYMDHFAAVGVPWKEPASNLSSALRAASPTSPAEIRLDLDSFQPPTWDELTRLGIATAAQDGVLGDP